MKLIVAIYARKSKSTDKGESTEIQIKLCMEYIKNLFPSDDVEFVIYNEGEGFSGADSKRKKFNKIKADAKKRKFNIVICYRLDRVARSVVDFSELIEELNSNDISFISVKEQFDTRTPMGRAMMYISSVFAQLEREIVAERIRDNMMELAKTGRWLGGNTPTGYESEGYELVHVKEVNDEDEVETKVKKAFMLKQIPEEILLVCEIYKKYMELKSQTGLEAYSLNRKLKTKNNKDFTRFSLLCILTNIVYAKNDLDMYNYLVENGIEIYAKKEDFDGEHGMIAYNKTKERKHKSNLKNPINDWIISVGKHKGCISGKDWIAVQEVLKNNQNKRYRKPPKNTALLSGILRCSECGSFMRPKIHTGRKNELGEERFSYVCNLKDISKKGRCQSANINGNELDRVLMKKIEEIAVPNSKIYQELEKITSSHDVIVEENQEVKMLKQAYDKNQKEMDNLIQRIKYVDIEIIDEINQEIKKIKKKNIEIKEKIDELNKENGTKKIDFSQQETARLVMEIMGNYFSKFYDLDIIERRNLLKLLINKATGSGERVEIDLLNSGDGNSSFFKEELLPAGEVSK